MAVPAPSPKEDPRDLEQLLRELGEAPAAAVKPKRKAAGPGAQLATQASPVVLGRQEDAASPQEGSSASTTSHAELAVSRSSEEKQESEGKSEAKLVASSESSASCVRTEDEADEDEPDAFKLKHSAEKDEDNGTKECAAKVAIMQKALDDHGIASDDEWQGGTISNMRSRSDGDLPELWSHVADDFHSKPSVGTWLSTPSRIAESASAEASQNIGRARPQSSTAPNPPQVWHAYPSVGTWLASPQSGRGKPEDGATQLWPATPESTPPSSPRPTCATVQHVFVPVPLHLVGAVQELVFQASVDAGPNWA